MAKSDIEKNKEGFISKALSVGQIKENHKQISSMASSLFNVKKIKENAKNETFEDAVSRLHVTKSDLKQNYKNLIYSLYASIFFMIICFLGVISSLFVQKDILNAITFLVVMFICVAQSFKFSFRAFQIKKKRLCTPKEWWDSASEWIPKLK